MTTESEIKEMRLTHIQYMRRVLCGTCERLISMGVGDPQLRYASDVDYFIFNYLLDTAPLRLRKKPRRRVVFLHSLLELVANPLFEEQHIWTLIDAMADYMLENELYEYLALNQKNRQVAKEVINKVRKVSVTELNKI